MEGTASAEARQEQPIMYLRQTGNTSDGHTTNNNYNTAAGTPTAFPSQEEGYESTRKSSAGSTSGATTLAPTPGNGGAKSGSDRDSDGDYEVISSSEAAGYSAQEEDGGKPVNNNGGDYSRPPARPRRLSTRYITADDMNDLHLQLSRRMTEASAAGGQSVAGESVYNPESDNFQLEDFLKRMFKEREDLGLLGRSAGVVFEDLCVDGLGSGVTFGETLGSTFTAPFRLLSGERKQPVKHILEHFTGAVEPGEMLLVLGRPGSGCSSLLKTLANQTGSFKAVNGLRSYSGISPEEMAKHHTGDLAYLPEDDIHLPVLTVDQTLEFAAASRAPAKSARTGGREEYTQTFKAVLLAIFGLRATVNTKVGNDYVRGISGGQRKRVSIAEAMLTRARVACHDNATRGLDASTSLEYVRSLRTATDIARMTTIVSLYQAGEGLFQEFDKVCIIYEGKMIYYGPREAAFDYFYQLGYEPQPRQTTPDFLCSITDPLARVPRENFEGPRPKTAVEFAEAWQKSELGKRNVKEVEKIKGTHSDEAAQGYRNSAKSERVRGLAKKTASDKADKHANPYVISYWQQTRLCVKRRIQLAKGDLPSLLIPIIASIIQAIIIGSTFFRIANNTSGFFSRGGVIFFAILFNALQALAEITTAYSQRPVIVRQRGYAMVHPSCDSVAQTLVDLPIKFFLVLIFDVILYFFTNLSTVLPSQFFVFFLFTYITTLTMIAFFRALAAVTKDESTATTIGGIGVLVFVIYTGYAIPRPSMKVWFRWISYAHPISFAFEAMLANEFRAYTAVPCATLIPPTGDPANQVCAIAGSTPGQATINANNYLAANYEYYWSNAWRNLGILLGFWIAFLVIQYVGTEFQVDLGAKPAVMVFKRGKGPDSVKKQINAGKGDEETVNEASGAQIADEHDEQRQKEAADQLASSNDVFLWQKVCYDVPTKNGMTRLLDNVDGFVVPGKLTALMGESGAGKTTLLNVLAQRVTMGVVTGDMLVNGKPLPDSFQRQTGYCQQQDVHLPTTTVREALEFSALLRQPKATPKEEKLAYVDSVIKMLEMESFQDALVGEVGEGLNVEQRKRLTVGVELAAKPALLLFADEPTSGLDSQSAWSIVQFLRKLADHGQAILCTIHQPSSELFQVFDRLLLLKKGGKTVYFGDIGKNSSTLIKYFESHGAAKCGKDANPAEYILECVGAGATAKVTQDWGEVWQKSDERKGVDKELERLFAEYKDKESEADKAPDSDRQYAASTMTQIKTVTTRVFRNYWRDPTYLIAKIALNVIAGLFIGFSFWMAPANQQGLQVYLFSVFMAVVLSATLAQQIQPKFIALRSLYEVRERPSRMYNFYVQTAASIIVEIPWNIFAGTLFWCCWYFTVGGQTGGRAFYSWISYAVAFEIYWQTFAQAVAAFSPNGQIASVIFSGLFSFVIVFNGVLQPPEQLPYFWRSWMYPLTPYTYLVGGLLSNFLGGLQLRCTPEQISYVIPPANVGTCADYLGQFVEAATGYLTNPDASGENCGYCQYGRGDEYLQTVRAYYSQRWRNFGILWGYIVFNVALVFVFMWAFRIHTWKKGGEKKSASTHKKDEKNKAKQVDGAKDTAEKPAEQV